MHNNRFCSGTPVTGKSKAYGHSKTLTLLLALFASITLTPAEYVECDSIFPDDALDFYGIPENPTLPHRTLDEPILLIFDFIFDFPIFFPQQSLSMENPSPQPANFEMLSPTLLRC